MLPSGPTVLFSLKPLNRRAQHVVAHSRNSHLVSTLPDGTRALDVGFHINSSPSITLATLGRHKTDIFIEITSIARLQCSFEINLDSKVVMLYDRSNRESTQVSGDNATPFEYSRLRRVVVQKGLNSILGMGGVRCDHVQFEIHWHYPPGETTQAIQKHEEMLCMVEDPRLARTVDEELEILSSQRLTRIHTSQRRKPTIRYVKIGDPLGAGVYGTVYKCIDIDSGEFMAVKILTRAPKVPQDKWERSVRHALKREVETISTISHVGVWTSILT